MEDRRCSTIQRIWVKKSHVGPSILLIFKKCYHLYTRSLSDFSNEEFVHIPRRTDSLHEVRHSGELGCTNMDEWMLGGSNGKVSETVAEPEFEECGCLLRKKMKNHLNQLCRTFIMTPFKLFTVFLHEVSHAVACKLTCGEVTGSKAEIFIVLEFVTGGELFDKIVNHGRMRVERQESIFSSLLILLIIVTVGESNIEI